MRWWGGSVILSVIVGVFAACGVAPDEEATAPLPVSASIPPHAWLVERIGGTDVQATAVLRPGESPATHQPTDAQVTAVLASRVYFAAGVPFESGSWFGAVGTRVPVVDLNRGIKLRHMAGHEGHAHGSVHGADPHVWLSPRRLAVQAATVAATLSELMPERAHVFDANLRTFGDSLDDLDRWLRATLEPFRGRAFMVFHPSWGYFADDYGLAQIAIEIDGKAPTDEELTRLQARAAELEISVVYVQPQIAGRAAATIADSIGCAVVPLDPLAPDVLANLRRVGAVLREGFDG